ncbi:hypothetical protein LPJ77_005681, partial [Coemansia sp. RSA 2523]
LAYGEIRQNQACHRNRQDQQEFCLEYHLDAAEEVPVEACAVAGNLAAGSLVEGDVAEADPVAEAPVAGSLVAEDAAEEVVAEEDAVAGVAAEDAEGQPEDERQASS